MGVVTQTAPEHTEFVVACQDGVDCPDADVSVSVAEGQSNRRASTPVGENKVLAALPLTRESIRFEPLADVVDNVLFLLAPVDNDAVVGFVHVVLESCLVSVDQDIIDL